LCWEGDGGRDRGEGERGEEGGGESTLWDWGRWRKEEGWWRGQALARAYEMTTAEIPDGGID
jgi:hypothetical protein